MGWQSGFGLLQLLYLAVSDQWQKLIANADQRQTEAAEGIWFETGWDSTRLVDGSSGR